MFQELLKNKKNRNNRTKQENRIERESGHNTDIFIAKVRKGNNEFEYKIVNS